MRTFVVIIILLLTFSPAGAQTYQWIGEDGVVIYQDTPPPATKSKKSRKVKVYEDGNFAPAPSSQPAPVRRSESGAATESQSAPSQKERFTGTVEMYVTEWCGYCKKAQAYLKSKGINYVTYDIEKDSAANQRHKDLGGRGVPLIIIGANKFSGFSPESLEYYLNNSR
jgi:glutaredoxin-like YruB-family protein